MCSSDLIHKAAGLALVDSLVRDDDPVRAQIVRLGCGEQDGNEQQRCSNEYNFLEWLHFFPRNVECLPHKLSFAILPPKTPFLNYKFVMCKLF